MGEINMVVVFRISQIFRNRLSAILILGIYAALLMPSTLMAEEEPKSPTIARFGAFLSDRQRFLENGSDMNIGAFVGYSDKKFSLMENNHSSQLQFDPKNRAKLTGVLKKFTEWAVQSASNDAYAFEKEILNLTLPVISRNQVFDRKLGITKFVEKTRRRKIYFTFYSDDSKEYFLHIHIKGNRCTQPITFQERPGQGDSELSLSVSEATELAELIKPEILEQYERELSALQTFWEKSEQKRMNAIDQLK